MTSYNIMLIGKDIPGGVGSIVIDAENDGESGGVCVRGDLVNWRVSLSDAL